MPRNTRARARTRAATAVTAGLICALSLTACEDTEEKADAGTPTTPAADGSGNTGGGNGGSDDGGVGSGGGVCSEDGLSFSATSEDGAGEPVRHLLLTVTNTGEEECDVYHYPYVQLGADAQAPAAVIEESAPQALVTLAPGDQAYAAVLVSGGAMDEYEADTVSLILQGRDPGSNASESVNVDLPGVDTLLADDGQLVTYWTTASGLALDFIMSR
jgi:hypothetical protein